jgi:hypothetical protein
MQTTIDHATDAGQITSLKLSDSITYGGHAADYFVSRNAGIDGSVRVDETIPISASRV